MRTLILALAAAATLTTLGLAAPAFASDATARGVTAGQQSTEFSSRHRHHWRHHRHHWRHHYGWGGPRCHIVWRWGHPVKVCRW